MALVAWYKLDGNALDSSGNENHGTASGVTWTSGKIGQGRSDGYITIPNNPSLQIIGSMTISFWIYINSMSARRTVINKAYGGEYTINLEPSGVLRFYAGKYGGNGSPYSSIDSEPLTLGRWYHATIVKQSDGSCTWYINGNFSTSGGANTNLVGSTSSSSVRIGTGYTGGNVDAIIDDVRIYNHTLSEKEVKELAKAKILHYKFDDFQEPTQNILGTITPSYSKWGTNEGTSTYFTAPNGNQGVCLEITSFTDGGVNWYSTGGQRNAEPSAQYTVSATIKYEGGTPSPNLLYLRQYRSDGTQISEAGQFSTSYIEDLGNGWYRAYRTFTTHAECAKLLIQGYEYKKIKIWIYDIQCEKKAHHTPYVANDRSGVIYDCSSYDNHGELQLETTPKWTSEAKIGDGAYDFAGVGKEIRFIKPTPKLQEFTLSAWVYNVQGDSRQSIIRNFWEVVGTSIAFWSYDFTNEYWRQSSSGVVPYGQWTHIATTWDGSVIRHYANGELVHTSATSSGTSQEFLGIAGYSGRNFSGKLDDVRIYATALSDDDIKELYQTRAALDSNGNLYVQGGFIEYPVNGCPPFSSWTLSGGAYLSGDVLILPQRGSSAISPFVDIDGKSWTWSVDFYSNSPKDGSVTDGGYLQGSSYYDLNKNSTPNTAGYSSNGNAGSYPINQWTRKVWSYVAGNSVKYLRINISNNASYTPVSFMAKNPAITINGTSSFVPYNSQSLLTTTPSISHTQEGNISSNVLSELGPTNGLIAYYPLNGNANDYSGNNNHGTNNGATITSGIRGSAYSFDGSADQFIDISGHGLHLSEMYNGGATFSCWIKPNIQQTRIAQNIAGFLYFIINASGKLQIMTRDVKSNANEWVYGVKTIPVGEWSHVVCVLEDGVGGKFYVNGEIDGVKNNDGVEIINRGTASRLGWYSDSSLNGAMTDARIYNRALSPEEIKSLYDATKPNPVPMQLSSDGTVYLSGQLQEV